MIRCLVLFVSLALVAACGRPLTTNERVFLASIHGTGLDLDKMRINNGAPTRSVTFQRKPRPRTTCRELILPPPVTNELVTARPAAIALYNTVLFDRDWYLEDYVPDYPEKISIIAAMLLAHEATHVWQWQNRALTGYSPLKAASEHGFQRDPYLFDIGGTPQFLDFGYEQQGSIVEEYVCCRALAPQAPRTERLHALIAQVMPVAALPQSRPHDVRLPWDGVELDGICG